MKNIRSFKLFTEKTDITSSEKELKQSYKSNKKSGSATRHPRSKNFPLPKVNRNKVNESNDNMVDEILNKWGTISAQLSQFDEDLLEELNDKLEEFLIYLDDYKKYNFKEDHDEDEDDFLSSHEFDEE